jgi:anti-anti-sigma regulatory factor
MLKISSTETDTELLLVLEGKLIAPWTDGLRNVCDGKGKGSDSDQPKLVIDVAGVTTISTDGEEVLLYLLSQGAKFRGGGVSMKQVLKQLARRVRGNDKDRKASEP